MNAHKIFLSLIGVLLFAGMAVAGCAQAPAASNTQPDKLLGAWNVQLTTKDQGSFPALMTFLAEGSVIADESPFGFESSGQGSWSKNADGQVAYTFNSLLGGQDGKNTGKIKVVGRIQYDASADRWQGPFRVNVTDAAGQELFADNGTLTMSRIVVEPLAFDGRTDARQST